MLDVQQIVAEGRAEAEALMSGSRWVIRRPDGEATAPGGFHVTATYTTVYDGRARLQTYEAHEQTTGGQSGSSAVVQRSTLQVPVGAFASLPGDIATCAESLDPLLVGRSVRITQEYPVKEHATAYRMFVDENIGEDVPPVEAP